MGFQLFYYFCFMTYMQTFQGSLKTVWYFWTVIVFFCNLSEKSFGIFDLNTVVWLWQWDAGELEEIVFRFFWFLVYTLYIKSYHINFTLSECNFLYKGNTDCQMASCHCQVAFSCTKIPPTCKPFFPLEKKQLLFNHKWKQENGFIWFGLAQTYCILVYKTYFSRALYFRARGDHIYNMC